jgi:DNA-binding NarL/FixJ family response regulator
VQAIRAVSDGKMYISQKIQTALGKNITDQKKSPLDRISPREREVLQLTVEGKTSTQIGQILSLSPKSVDTYRSRIMKKLDIHDTPALVKFAIQHGLTSLEN